MDYENQEYEGWETPEQQHMENVEQSMDKGIRGKNWDLAEKNPHLWVMIGKQKFYTPFLFYTLLILFMGMIVFNYKTSF